MRHLNFQSKTVLNEQNITSILNDKLLKLNLDNQDGIHLALIGQIGHYAVNLEELSLVKSVIDD
jgi:hypothetical protein